MWESLMQEVWGWLKRLSTYLIHALVLLVLVCSGGQFARVQVSVNHCGMHLSSLLSYYYNTYKLSVSLHSTINT